MSGVEYMKRDLCDKHKQITLECNKINKFLHKCFEKVSHDNNHKNACKTPNV